MQATDGAQRQQGVPEGKSTRSIETILACLACTAKLILPPACAHLLSDPHPTRQDCKMAHLSHGRGPAGEFLAAAAPPFAMGAAAEVATMPLTRRAPARSA